MKEKILARERACFEFLEALPKDKKYVLIGGYAVSAFEFPRLSVDLDIAIPQSELKFFEKLVKTNGFELSTERSDIDEIYSGKFKKFVKKVELPVSVDLLINSVKSRQTDVSYPFDYLYGNSEVREVTGWHPGSRATVRVADKEMLIALKMNAMRPTDKRDILVLCYEKPDIEKIIQHISRCPRDIIKKHINELMSLIEDTRNIDSIKGVFGISEDVHKKAIRNCKAMIRAITERSFN
ncbi:MAG: hypothetical protein DRP62_08940 [Planctomycetota bacterium]|nr:MAG: hypothetical protein DRP62_08940 [Planctomycetota bacterium]